MKKKKNLPETDVDVAHWLIVDRGSSFVDFSSLRVVDSIRCVNVFPRISTTKRDLKSLSISLSQCETLDRRPGDSIARRCRIVDCSPLPASE